MTTNITLAIDLKKPWKITQQKERDFGIHRLEHLASLINRTIEGFCYILDYRTQRIIVGDTPRANPCGYTKQAIQKTGLNIYTQILEDGEAEWLEEMNKDAHRIFYTFLPEVRKTLEFCYDLKAKTARGRTIFLHHKLTPLQLCGNHNLWLGLCCVYPHTTSDVYKASIISTQTKQRFDYIDGRFVGSQHPPLNQEDYAILDAWTLGILEKNIPDLLQISRNVYRDQKSSLLEKLESTTAMEAVYKAFMLGYF